MEKHQIRSSKDSQHLLSPSELEPDTSSPFYTESGNLENVGRHARISPLTPALSPLRGERDAPDVFGLDGARNCIRASEKSTKKLGPRSDESEPLSLSPTTPSP